jgi:hypothetical protein
VPELPSKGAGVGLSGVGAGPSGGGLVGEPSTAPVPVKRPSREAHAKATSAIDATTIEREIPALTSHSRLATLAAKVKAAAFKLASLS